MLKSVNNVKQNDKQPYRRLLIRSFAGYGCFSFKYRPASLQWAAAGRKSGLCRRQTSNGWISLLFAGLPV